MTIIEDGKAQCVIVHSANATDQEKSAAKDLQTYLKKISGAKIEIIIEGVQSNKFPIYIGSCNAAKNQGLLARLKELKDDGYIIKITPEAIYMVGKDPLATRFAVFGLLEDHLGVRWYMPGDIGEVIPYSNYIVLNEMEDVREPSFPMRWIGSGYWALRNRMNVGVDDKLGMHIYGAAHTFCKLGPVNKYFDKHHEYFALVDGERKRYNEDPCLYNQLETANPEVIWLVAENASKVLKERPELDVMTIFPNDGLNFSESKESKALDDPTNEITVEDINSAYYLLAEPKKYGVLSRRMTIFYNEVAQLILNKYPKKYIQVGAYSAYRTPPKNLNIKAPEHTIIELTHNDCHNLPIESDSCNATYSQAIDGWLNIFSSFSIYEYYWKLAGNELPYPIVHSIRRDIPYFHEKGGFGLFTQYSSKNVGTLGLNYYVAAKLLWDVNANVDKILDDFYHKFYGPAWEPMKKYYESLEKAAIDSNVQFPAEYSELPLIFNKKLLSECELYLNQAKAIVQGESTYTSRINMSEISFGYVKKAMEYVNSLKQSLPSSGWYNGKTQLDLTVSKNLANEILSYLNENASSNCFHTPLTSYVEDFLDPEKAIKGTACDSDKVNIDKSEWVKQKGDTTIKKGVFSNIPFDIWIYGNDFDKNSVKSEHGVYLIDKNGMKVKVGEIATELGGDSVNRCYVFKGLNSEQFIYNKDTLELHISNPKGDWIQSTFYAVYIMPHDPTINIDIATNIIKNNIETLPEQSYGVIEYCYYGIKDYDGITLKLSLSLYDKPSSPNPPQNLRIK